MQSNILTHDARITKQSNSSSLIKPKNKIRRTHYDGNLGCITPMQSNILTHDARITKQSNSSLLNNPETKSEEHIMMEILGCITLKVKIM